MLAAMAVGTTGLVERDEELARVHACVEGAREGHGAFLAIEGEAGIGKSALLASGVAHGREFGLTLLAARASELERGFPFGVVRQALGRVAAEREDLLVGQAALARAALAPGADTGAASEGLLHGLYWLVAALADEQPAVLSVDDLHWADEESLAFLRFLAVRLPGMRASVLVTTRPPADEDPAARLLGDPAVEICRPRALGPEGVSAFLGQQLGREPDPAFVEACRAVAGGNPFLLEQLVAAARTEGIEPSAADAPRVAQLQPEGLALTLVGRLDPASRALARAVAILGDDVETSLAAELAGVDAPEAAADALAAAGVLADQRPLRFRHALLRAAVLGRMRAGEQARAHGEAVALLRAQGAPAERIAAHLLLLDPRGDPEDAATLREAADEALARGAPGSAIPLLQRALADAADRFPVLCELARAETSLGRPAAADHALEAVELAATPEQRMRAALLAGRSGPSNPGRLGEILAALEDLGPPPDRVTSVRIMNAQLMSAWSDMPRFHRIVRGAKALEPITGETADECLLLSQLARTALETGGTAAEVSAHLDGALRHPSYGETAYLVPVLLALNAVDRPDESDALSRRALSTAVERGERLLFHMALSWGGRAALQRGDLALAEERARTALAAVDTPTWWAMIPLAVLAETLVDQGRPAEIAAPWAALGLGETLPQHRALNQLLHARARWRAAEGDVAGALADLREIAHRVGPAADQLNWLATRLRTAELLHRAGDPDEAGRLAAAAVELTRRFGAPSSLGWALRVQGQVTGDEAALREAVERLADSPARLEHARALIALGGALRRGGGRRASREPLREGHDMAVACGAAPDAAAARAELAAGGVHVERLSSVTRDELTASERRIAELAGGGASNKEIAQSLFLTVKTVEMHLSSAYRKLDIRSRRDLPAALTGPPG
jgi:DNA-binding CsgD family transcriptional regulator/tetratricopeptide (TPR) repeat protein